MIYKGLNRTGMIGDIKTKGGGEIAEVYGGIGESNPIYYKQREIVGTSPMQFKALGLPLKDYRISGETLQDGTPSPDMPVDVVGCGVRTENLFDKDNVLENYYLKNGVPTEYHFGDYVLSDYIPIASNTATISAKITTVSDFGAHWAVYDENKTFIRGGIAFDARKVGNIARVVDTSGAAFIRVDYALEYLTDCMLNLGSTALPYEPYGYKIPVTVNGTEYPIYLGQVEATRRIKKLVLTGEEDWSEITAGLYCITVNGYLRIAYIQVGMSSHFNGGYAIRSVPSAKTDELTFLISDSGNNYVYLSSHYLTTADFKSYLAQQYVNGTPVTIWYILAEPETGIVNEPLHKIGDYADTISMAQASVTIPTTAGTNTLTVGTTVQPSSVSITGHIKPVTS